RRFQAKPPLRALATPRAGRAIAASPARSRRLTTRMIIARARFRVRIERGDFRVDAAPRGSRQASDAAAQRALAALGIVDLDVVRVGNTQREDHIAPGLPVVEQVDDSIDAGPGLHRARVLEIRNAAASVVADGAIEFHVAWPVAFRSRAGLGRTVIGP